MKITYTNPAPEEDMIPNCAVHYKDRGRRYFDYADLWFQQLDRQWVVEQCLAPIDQSPEKDVSDMFRHWLGLDPRRPGLSQVGMVTQDLRLATKMVHRGIDFVFDATSGLFFFDLRGKHEIIMKDLLLLHTGRGPVDDRAGAYLEQGMGLFRSSQSSKIHAGQEMALPAWAKHPALSVHRMA